MAKKEQATIETVTMEDGTVVDFPGTRKMLKTFDINEDTGEITVRIDFRNGKFVSLVVPGAITLRAAAHGILQKLGDEAASFKDSIDDAFTAVEALAERLGEGNWNAERESNTVSGQSFLVQALMEFRSKSLQEVKEFLKDKTREEKLAMKQNPKLQPIIKRLEEERAATQIAKSGVDSDALLDDF